MFFLILILVVLVTLYFYGTRTYGYWSERDVKHDPIIPFLGTNLRGYLFQKGFAAMITDNYWKYPNEKVVGFYRGTRPELIIRDPNIAKRVLVSDFMHFYLRGFTSPGMIEPLFRNLFFAEGNLWRLLRQRMTPAFSSGKLKAMFPLIVERAEKLQQRVLTAAASGAVLDARDLMARYATDFIGACGFGLHTDSLSQEDSTFRKLGVKFLKPESKMYAKAVLKELFPEIFKNLTLLDSMYDDITVLLEQILKERNYKPSTRNDFVDLLLECKEKGLIVGESIENVKKDGTAELVTLEIDDDLIAAQVFVFFLAGFETSSSATSFTLHQLAYHPEAQQKVQEEIDRVLAKYDNKLSYNAIKEMTYLGWAFKEGLRIFPSLGFLVRKCARDYTFPDLNLTIDKGVKVLIPVEAMQNDPKYFKNPEEFRPERFSPEEFSAEAKDVFLPFGAGPRACIGERLGLMQSLAGLAAVLARFTVDPAPQTRRHPIVDPRSTIFQFVKGGLPLYFQERKLTSVN